MRFIIARTLFQHSENTAVLPIAVLSHVVDDKESVLNKTHLFLR